MNRVIVSFTTLPSRFRFIEPMVECIINQSYQDFEFHLNIPKHSDLEGVDYEIPSWTSKYPKLQIHQADRDWGSHTKLVPTLKRESDPDAIIITVDDDLVYHHDLIKLHMELRATKYPNSAIGFAGLGSFDGVRFCTSVEKDYQVRVVEGYKSVSYLRKFFDSVYYSCARLNWCDDTTIGCMLGKNGIKKYVCAWPGETDFSPRVESFPIVGKLCHQWEPSGCRIRKHSSECMLGVPYADEVTQEWIQAGWYDAR
jgi:hypothetical protein